jgi:hypothetical protein
MGAITAEFAPRDRGALVAQSMKRGPTARSVLTLSWGLCSRAQTAWLTVAAASQVGNPPCVLVACVAANTKRMCWCGAAVLTACAVCHTVQAMEDQSAANAPKGPSAKVCS